MIACVNEITWPVAAVFVAAILAGTVILLALGWFTAQPKRGES